MATGSRSKKNIVRTNLTALTTKAASYLSMAQDLLPLDDNLVERDRQVAVGLVQFPAEALATTIAILEAEPDRFRQFDLNVVRDSLTYEQAMMKVKAQAEALVSIIQRSLMKRHAAGIEQSLALYEWLQRLSRNDGTVVKHVESLAPFIVQHRSGKRKKKTAVAPVVQPASAPAKNGSASVITNGASAPAPASVLVS